MVPSNETIALLVVGLVLFLVIWIFIRLTIRIRRGGGSLTTIALGATDAFLTKDRRKAAETILNRNAGKTFESQSSDEPIDPDVMPESEESDLKSS